MPRADRAGQAPQPERDACEQRQGRPLGGDREKRADFGRGAFEHIGAPEVEWHRGELEADADQDEEHAEDDDRLAQIVAGADVVNQIGEIPGAVVAGDQADAVEHDPRCAAAVDHVLEGGFARLPSAFQEAGQGIAGQAGHLDADEDHQQMIRRRHDRHAEHRAEQEDVEIGRVFLVGNAGQHRQEDDERGEGVEEHLDEDREVVEHQHAAEHLRGQLAAAPFVKRIGIGAVPLHATGETDNAPAIASDDPAQMQPVVSWQTE